MSHGWQLWRRFIGLSLASLVFCISFHPWSTGQAESATEIQQQQLLTPTAEKQLVSKGIESYQIGEFAQAITFWEQALPQITDEKDRAIVHNNLALAYRQMGELAQAIAHWEKAIQIYQALPDAENRKQIAGLLTEQAQTYNDLGQHPRAITLLESAIELTTKYPDPLTQAAAQGALGNAHWSLGNYDQALSAHKRSLKIARELNNTSFIATALNNLGNVYMSQATRYSYQAQVAELEGDIEQTTRLTQEAIQDWTQARTFFEQSLQTAQALESLTEIKALMNLNRWVISRHLVNVGNNSAQPLSSADQEFLQTNWQRVRELLVRIPDSRQKAYTLINLAESFQRIESEASTQESIQLLSQAMMVAQKIGDAKAQSFALGSLGQLYESAGDYSTAMELTRQAEFRAQQIQSSDSLYRWQWQAGRMLKARGATTQAISAYEGAISTLQNIRGDLVTNKELQLDFREQVEPVYRELIDLLLNASSGDLSDPNSQVAASPLKKVIDIVELLKLAELENFFGDECVQVAKDKAQNEKGLADANAAVIYSIILNDRTEMILRSPDGSLKNYPVPISKEDMEAEIEQLRYFLELRTTEQYIFQAKEIYNLLIRPLEADLALMQPKTLVFINDGVLRQIPMSALHDGQKFLIEKYPIAITPSLSLTTSQPLDHNHLSVLSMGLTVARPPFSALTNVKAELNAVEEILGGTELIDQEFTFSNLQAKLRRKNFPVVHMATHGKFGVDSQSTFLLGYDQQISIEELDNLLRSRGRREAVKLLTLSACQTATGNNRSALGIAGVAVRAGVESALATLWYINDEATVPLIAEFYSQLSQPDITRAEALRQAQLQMISNVNYNHPAVWSPFILIGNWN
ncbi:MAG: CHAT domain-containing protein [Coleofasciculus sp. G1-WW12-02]|uniref:CHAT domain-containing protein n=1 Tax=Coleofasciculus sp. G1-WW12-02 TaxID=3068483 RepID=UPI0032F2158E